jgi:hypothetical protein
MLPRHHCSVHDNRAVPVFVHTAPNPPRCFYSDNFNAAVNAIIILEHESGGFTRARIDNIIGPRLLMFRLPEHGRVPRAKHSSMCEATELKLLYLSQYERKEIIQWEKTLWSRSAEDRPPS